MATLSCLVMNYNKKDLSSISRHLRFINEYPDAQPDLNRDLYPLVLIAPSLNTLHKSIFSRVAQRENQDRSIHGNTILLHDIQVKCSVNKMLSPADMLSLFKNAADYLTQKFRQTNCIYAVIHCEENVPHMHFGIVPMTENNRLCAGQNLYHKKLQSGISEHLRLTEIDTGDESQIKKTAAAVITPKPRRWEVQSRQKQKKEEESRAELKEIHTKVQSLSLQNQQYEEQLSKLYRENQNLKLERIFLNRQLSNLSEILRLNPDLENRVESQVKIQATRKHAYHFAATLHNQPLEDQIFSEECNGNMP